MQKYQRREGISAGSREPASGQPRGNRSCLPSSKAPAKHPAHGVRRGHSHKYCHYHWPQDTWYRKGRLGKGSDPAPQQQKRQLSTEVINRANSPGVGSVLPISWVHLQAIPPPSPKHRSGKAGEQRGCPGPSRSSHKDEPEAQPCSNTQGIPQMMFLKCQSATLSRSGG